MNVARTIFEQIKCGRIEGCQCGLHAMMCWGARGFANIGNGLLFKVSGRKLKGTVRVMLDEGSDLYNLHFLNLRGREINKIEGVYFDQLAELIDGVIEK